MSKEQNSLSPIKEKLDVVFEKVGELTKVQRLIICLVTFAIIGASFYYLFYVPRQDELTKVKKEYKTQKQKLDKYKRDAKDLLKYERKMAATQEKFNQAMKALPDKRELPSLLTGISKAGSDAGLTFILFKPEIELAQTFYKEIPVSIKVSGHYHQITDFFFQIIKLNRIVNINNVKVTSKNDTTALEMTCKAVTYMFVESQPVSKKNKKKRKKAGKK